VTQLDNITWFPQILWLFVIFFSLYVLIYKNFGPLSFYNQNLRSKKIEKHYSSAVFYDYLNVDTRFKRFNVISNNFN
jgi:hypothetical protein